MQVDIAAKKLFCYFDTVVLYSQHEWSRSIDLQVWKVMIIKYIYIVYNIAMGSWDPVLQTAFWNEQIIMIDQEHIRTGDLCKSV